MKFVQIVFDYLKKSRNDCLNITGAAISLALIISGHFAFIYIAKSGGAGLYSEWGLLIGALIIIEILLWDLIV